MVYLPFSCLSYSASGAGLRSATSLINSCNSPFWNMSKMMSQPPTNSPSTHNCGNVGQSANFGNSARISGFCRISTYANAWPQLIRACEACEEKPQLGNFGEPFMYNRIGFSAICCLIFSTVSMTTSGVERFERHVFYHNQLYLTGCKKGESYP